MTPILADLMPAARYTAACLPTSKVYQTSWNALEDVISELSRAEAAAMLDTLKIATKRGITVTSAHLILWDMLDTRIAH